MRNGSWAVSAPPMRGLVRRTVAPRLFGANRTADPGRGSDDQRHPADFGLHHPCRAGSRPRVRSATPGSRTKPTSQVRPGAFPEYRSGQRGAPECAQELQSP